MSKSDDEVNWDSLVAYIADAIAAEDIDEDNLPEIRPRSPEDPPQPL